MTTELPEGEFNVLWDDGACVLLRARHKADRSPTLVLRPAIAHPTKTSLSRMEQAYALRGELDGSWAARPIGLKDENGRLALLVEDLGGDPLSMFLGKACDV
jgi:hypothetical protein